tara:strand:- start:137 stop:652 length:516 start_codon:yes stop_codon:yes gene_type:complete
MKLTKKKLEQLIVEAYTRRISDEGKPINYPEYADKLTRLAKDDYPQARELADTLDEPLDIELSQNKAETIPFKDDKYRISKFRRWMVSKGYGAQIRKVVLYKKFGKTTHTTAEKIFKEFVDETKDYSTHNAVVAAYRVDYIPFLNEKTGEPLPLSSPRPFRSTNTYHYPRS